MDNNVKNNKKIIVIVLVILILIVGGIVTFLVLNNKSETKDNKESNTNNQVEVNNEENKTEETKKIEEEPNEENKTIEKQTTKNSSEVVIDIAYTGKIPYQDDEFEVKLILSGDDYYTMNYGSIAGRTSYGKYEIKGNQLILNQEYYSLSDCSTLKGIEKFTFIIENGKINANINSGNYNVKNVILSETEDVGRTGLGIFTADICEVENEESEDARMPIVYKAASDEGEITIAFLPFRNYLMKYCNENACNDSYGTYEESNGTLKFNQTRNGGSDACYYKESKNFTATYVKLTEEEINNKSDKYVANYKNIKINLANKVDLPMPNKEFELTEADVDLYSILSNVDLFTSYCGIE